MSKANSKFQKPADSPAEPRDGQVGRLTSEQIERWAELIADGADNTGASISAEQEPLLTDALQRRHRERLIDLVAQAVAADIARAGAADGQETLNDPSKV